MSLINLYAIGSDLLTIVDSVEKQIDIRYASCGLFLKGQENIFGSFVDIPNFSKVQAMEKGIIKDEYLIVEKNEILVPEFINGIGKYTFNQLFNPNSVILQPGGLLEENLIVSGSISSCTTSDSLQSKKIFNLFQREIKKRFKKVRAYWVGEDAYKVLVSGGRLTPDKQCPVTLDLKC